MMVVLLGLFSLTLIRGWFFFFLVYNLFPLGKLVHSTFGFRPAVSVHRGPVFADPFAWRSHAGAKEVMLVVNSRSGAQARGVRLRSGRVRRWLGGERGARTRRFLAVPLCARLLARCPLRTLLFLAAFELSDGFVRALDSRAGLLAHCHPDQTHTHNIKNRRVWWTFCVQPE